MNFRTELSIKKSPWSIDLNSPVLTLGSCFAHTIGSRLENFKFPTSINPFGTTYHPFAIHKLLKYAVYNESPPDHTYLEHDGIHANYDFHSENTSPTKSGLQKRICETIGSVHYFLKNCKVLILTYGTAWMYERIDTGEVVANCHKMPAALFTRRLANADEISQSFIETFKILKSFQPGLQIILSVSPVRHVKDTLELNSVSKSVLRTVCHNICESQNDFHYFPAFEIMLDDLRDYRFYESDLIHPTTFAEHYIWEKFSSAYFSPATVAFIHHWEEIQKALSHRPFHPESKGHQEFLRETLTKIKELKSIINVDKELNLIQSQLINS